MKSNSFNKAFSPDSLNTAENNIKGIVNSSDYKLLGEVGRQFVQGKIVELPENANKIALQAEFNKQLLNAARANAAKTSPAMLNSIKNVVIGTWNIVRESMRGKPDTTLKNEGGAKAGSQVSSGNVDTTNAASTSTGMLNSIKSAVTGTWNLARESIRGKPDTTSKNEGGAKTGSQFSSVNVETTNAASTSTGMLNSIKSAVTGAWNITRERMRGKADATSMNASLAQTATGDSTVKVNATPSAPPSESKKSGSWFSRAITYISSTIGYNRTDNNNISISAPIAPPGQHFAHTTPPPKTPPIPGELHATHSTSDIMNRLGATTDYKSAPESKSLPQRLKEIEDLFDKELIMMTSLHENFARTMSIDYIVECINSVHNETPSVDGERRKLVMKTLENMQRKIEVEFKAVKDNPTKSTQKAALEQILQEGFKDKGMPLKVIEIPSKKTNEKPSPVTGAVSSHRSAP